MKRLVTILALLLTISGCSGASFLGNSKRIVSSTDSTAVTPTATPTPTPTVAPMLTTATLSSIAVTPLTSTISVGGTQQFIATGTYSDATTQDITSSVTWSSSAIATADFTTAGTPGLLTASTVGTLTVTATSGALTATATVSVTAATLQSITITPNPIEVATFDGPIVIIATGTYSDGTTADISAQVTWNSSKTTIATLSSNSSSQEVLNPVSAGDTTVTATLSGISGTAPATVTIATTITCKSGVVALQSNQSIQLAFSGVTAVNFSVSASPALAAGSMGSVSSLTTATKIAALYYSPSKISQQETITITATPVDTTITPASCTVRLIPDGALGVPDDGKTKGLVGNVYNSYSSGNSAMTFATVVAWNPVNPKPTDTIVSPAPVATIVIPNLNVPNTPFSNGFPGVPNLVEWFAIRFDGQILIPTAGNYEFAFDADDGALLYLDGSAAPVVNDDGVHAIGRATGTIHLTAGQHKIHIDYFEGPKNYIAAILWWKGPNDSQLTVVPAIALSRPLGN